MSASGPGEVLFEFVRHGARRFTGDESALANNGRLVLVAEVVHSLTMRYEAATVTAVTREIGLDQSGASRLIKNAVQAGYLTVTTSTADRRRREVSLTSAGVELLDQAHQWQERVFDELAAGWSEQERQQFRGAMLTLMERSHRLSSAPLPQRAWR